MQKVIIIGRYIAENNTRSSYYNGITTTEEGGIEDTWTDDATIGIPFRNVECAEATIISFQPDDGYYYKIETIYK